MDKHVSTLYLKMRGTIKRSDIDMLRKILKETIDMGEKPLEFKEIRTYYYIKANRDEDYVQFAERKSERGSFYSFRYRGMTSERKDNLRIGAGAEYECSYQGASLLREMGMAPVKRRDSVGIQWNLGNGIYLVVSNISAEIKSGLNKDIDKNFFRFELFSFCPDAQSQFISQRMRVIIDMLKPYLIVKEKPDMGFNVSFKQNDTQ